MKKIVLIEDDIYIRESLKSVLNIAANKFKQKFKLYSSSNGAEGLGLVYIANPDYIIVDLTLPKYSGKEVLDFLVNNEKINQANTKILVLHENTEPLGLSYKTSNPNIQFLNKSQKGFLYALLEKFNDDKDSKLKYSFFQKTKIFIASRAIYWANSSDKLMRKITSTVLVLKTALYPIWFICQFVASFYLSLLYIFVAKVKDDNIDQVKQDESQLRINSYPTLATVLVTLFIITFQVGLFIAGGLVIANTRIESVFALVQNQKAYEFSLDNQSDYIYDNNLVEFTESGVQLKFVSTEVDSELDNIPATIEQEPVSFPEVLGLESQKVFSTTYITEKPSIITKEDVRYSDLIKIIEYSSINNAETSITEKLDTSETAITYQLSPDAENWFYFEKISETDGEWTKTTNEWQSSNSIQEINKYLSEYESSIGGGSLYLKIFLQSNSGLDTPILEEIIVEKESDLVATFENVSIDESEEEVETISSIDLDTIEPVIFNASFVNGNKVILGKLLNKNKLSATSYELSGEELSNYTVNIYFSSAEVGTKESLIGTTNLYINPRGELEFLLITPSTPGGYVTAEVSFDSAQDDTIKVTPLARPVENSTFTVDSTGDAADSADNGLCATAGGVCTLRAAIREANFVGGSDNIYFNIPTSDAGYRDYDTPDTASSGDSVGGDDYWTIRPATSLPAITGATVIDADTQTVNQLDSNNQGPEIEIAGPLAGAGLGFGVGSSNSSINAISINRFASYNVNFAFATESNYLITSSYLCTDVRGMGVYATTQNGISAAANNVEIGLTTSDGNIISGCANGQSIGSDPGVRSPANNIFVRGNKLGLNYDDTVPTNNSSYGLFVNNSVNIIIGGSNVTDRNIISGLGVNGIRINNSSATNQEYTIANNFIGTDTTGTLARNIVNNSIQIDTTLAQSTNNLIGGENQGNLIRYSNVGSGVRIQGERNLEISHNTIGNITNGLDAGITLGGNLVTTNYNSVWIKGNFIGATNSDPYFGLQIGASQNGMLMNAASPLIQGNVITGNAKAGIMNMVRNTNTRTTDSDDVTSTPTIGGTLALSGSICNGLEANCISNNTWSGIYSLDTIPFNETTLFGDNDFTGGNGTGSNRNIEQAWLSLFEVFSGTNRRTDLSGLTVTFPSGTAVRSGDDPTTTVTTATAINVACLNTAGSGCPASGHTIGTVDNTHMFVPSGQTSTALNNNFNWFRVTEYLVDGTGTRTNYDTFKFEQNHFASNTFTYDGESTDNVINTGTGRTLNSQNYTDRGEPWTNLPGATRDIASRSFGRFQIMEVEYVDANPILQGDGSYIITVDSTENVLTAAGTTFFNDGAGNATGGMSKLATATLANGQTSFLEAAAVATAKSGADKIHFNIPTSDSGWNTVNFPNAFRIPVTSIITFGNGTEVDGSTQTLATGDTNVSNYSTTDVTQNLNNINYTNGPEVILDFTSYASTLPLRVNESTASFRNMGFYNLLGVARRVFFVSGPVTDVSFINNDFVNLTEGAIQSPQYTRYTIEGNVFRSVSAVSTKFAFDIFEFGIASNTSIRHNLFMDSYAMALNLDASSIGAATNVQITDNVFRNIGTNQDGVQQNGTILLTRMGSTNLSNNYAFDSRSNFINVALSSGPVTLRENIINSISTTAIPYKLNDAGSWTYVLIPNTYTPTPNDSGDSDSGPNNLMNYPVITSIKYLGAGQYRLAGELDNSVGGESPKEIEICLSDNHISDHGGCIDSLGFTTASSPWAGTVTIPGDDGTQSRSFTTLATNVLGATSEFGANVTTSDPEFEIEAYPIELVSPANNAVLDTQKPVLDWNAGISSLGGSDPDLDNYEVYVDGTLITTVEAEITQFQVPTNLNFGQHKWKVIGKRINSTQSGESVEVNFSIQSPIYEFSSITPVDSSVDTYFPYFDWTDAITDSSQNLYTSIVYDLYIDGSLFKSDLTSSEYQLTSDESLSEGTHTWFVVAYGIDNEGGKVEIQRTNSSTFSVLIPVETQLEEPISFPVTTPTAPSDNEEVMEIGEILAVSFVPLVVGSSIIIATSLLSSTASSLTNYNIFGIVIGWLFFRKKKYWGIIYDRKTYKPIPLTSIKLYKLKNNEFIKETVSDLEGKYAFTVEEKGEYVIEVKVANYIAQKTTIFVNDELEIVADIGLERGINESGKEKRRRIYHVKGFYTIADYIFTALMLAGFMYTVYAVNINPAAINYILLVIYILIFVANIIIIIHDKLTQRKGKIIDKSTKKGLEGVSVRVYNEQRQVGLSVSDKNGIVRFNLRKGEYKLIVYKAGYQVSGTADQNENALATFVAVKIEKGGYFDSDIEMETTGTKDSLFDKTDST